MTGPINGQATAVAYCEDASDVLLTGACERDDRVTGHDRPGNVDFNPNNPMSWSCGQTQPWVQGTAATVVAYATCLEID